MLCAPASVSGRGRREIAEVCIGWSWSGFCWSRNPRLVTGDLLTRSGRVASKPGCKFGPGGFCFPLPGQVESPAAGRPGRWLWHPLRGRPRGDVWLRATNYSVTRIPGPAVFTLESTYHKRYLVIQDLPLQLLLV